MVHPLLKYLWIQRKTVILLVAPVILLPLPLLVDGKEASCGYVMLLMCVYWTTEALPLAITALFPLFLFPLLGVLPASQVGTMYFKDATWLFFSSMMIAVAVESTELHRRIALRALMLVGVKPKMLMLGFMVVTFFLSMWITNAATTALMIPIAEAIMKELYGSDENDGSDEDTEVNLQPAPRPRYTEAKRRKQSKRVERELSITKGITICIPFSASIGGIATITGTPPNVVLAGQYVEIFPDATPKLSFGIWFSYCLPQATVMLVLAYIWLSCWFIGPGIKGIHECCNENHQKQGSDGQKVKDVLLNEYRKLGNVSWAEGTVMVVFAATALLWFLRDPGFMPGLSSLFPERYVSDSTVAMIMVVLLFVLPQERPNPLRAIKDGTKPSQAILDWRTVQSMFPWQIPILVGGGFALADAATETGLSYWLSEQIAVLKGMDVGLICLLSTSIVCLLTEVTSNTATANLIIPILAELALTLRVHPLYLLLPSVIATSFAFMLPVATPANAIAFSYGRIAVLDLVKSGAILNVMGILVTILFTNTYAVSLFGLDEFPAWANSTSQRFVSQPAFNVSGPT